MNIGIIGLGLIGGSAAKAISAYTGHRVYAMDRDEKVMDEALACGAIKGRLSPERLEECHVVFLALYPKAALKWAEVHWRNIKKGAVLVDFCGVKRAVVPRLSQLAGEGGFLYLGGHPMAGLEKSGFAASTGDLFQGASMILTPSEQGREGIPADLEELLRSMGFARITRSTPEEHDRIIAYTSQLAHVLSSAYVKSPSALEFNGFSAGSFRDMTRVAWLSEAMWTELFLENRDYLAQEVEGLADRLAAYGKAIRQGDEEELYRLLKEGRLRKEAIEEKSPESGERNRK